MGFDVPFPISVALGLPPCDWQCIPVLWPEESRGTMKLGSSMLLDPPRILALLPVLTLLLLLKQLSFPMTAKQLRGCFEAQIAVQESHIVQVILVWLT